MLASVLGRHRTPPGKRQGRRASEGFPRLPRRPPRMPTRGSARGILGRRQEPRCPIWPRSGLTMPPKIGRRRAVRGVQRSSCRRPPIVGQGYRGGRLPPKSGGIGSARSSAGMGLSAWVRGRGCAGAPVAGRGWDSGDVGGHARNGESAVRWTIRAESLGPLGCPAWRGSTSGDGPLDAAGAGGGGRHGPPGRRGAACGCPGGHPGTGENRQLRGTS